MSTSANLRATLGLLFFIANIAIAQESYDVEKMSAKEAYKQGMLLRAQFKNLEARQYLKYAADNGNADAAYSYAMETMGYHDSVRAIGYARGYLIKAAQGGSRPALKYLYRNGDWLSLAKRDRYRISYYNSLIEQGASAPDIAYLNLSEYFHSSDPKLSDYYLDKAMEFELPSAYMVSAQRIENGEGDFFFDSDRESQFHARYLRAAESGYVPAIKRYTAILESKGKFRQALEWRETALRRGDITSLVTLGTIYSGNSPRYEFVELDLVKAKAYFELYLENAGQDRLSNVYKQVESNYKDTVDKIAQVQLPKSEAVKQELSEVEFFFNHDYLWNTY